MTNEAAHAVPFGSWPSPISADLVASGGVGVGGPAARGSEIWWSELRPTEGGRAVLVARDGDGPAVDRLAAPWSARTRVHEYGGGAWWLGGSQEPTARWTYFTEWSDQRLYRFSSETEPQPLTPEPAIAAGWRYADGREHPDGEWLAVVREDHHVIDREASGGPTEAANEIVAVALNDEVSDPTVLVTGADFVSTPRFSPDGRWLSWIQWDHPNMPWETTSLCAAPVFANMRLGNVQVIAGAPVEDAAGGNNSQESIHGADWTKDGRLVFSSDRNGFWNLYSWSPTGAETATLTELVGAEIGAPPWVFGVKRWTELDDGRLVVAVTTAAVDSLAVLDARSSGSGAGQLSTVTTSGLTMISGLATSAGSRILMVAAGPGSSSAVLGADIDTGQTAVIRAADDTGVDPAWFSAAEAIEFSSGDRTAHAFFYPPTGVSVTGPDGEAPPLIVMGHGGPTSHSQSALNLKVQYWTSRGFAVVDVNYGGSSGFGRAYRDLLYDSWGVVDVEDCISATRYLAETGRVDGSRLAIRGGSAGGFTVLAVLISSDDFAAGTSLYGVADLTALAADTHKFESRYLDRLIGPYPQRRDLYEERSPINHTDSLSSPLLVLQGLEDEIVPPNQSEAIVAALAAKGVPHAYVAFEGEQHGFRKAENIIRSLEVELWFYGKILGFEPADAIEPAAGAVGLGPA